MAFGRSLLVRRAVLQYEIAAKYSEIAIRAITDARSTSCHTTFAVFLAHCLHSLGRRWTNRASPAGREVL